jgi:hypothetical protein
MVAAALVGADMAAEALVGAAISAAEASAGVISAAATLAVTLRWQPPARSTAIALPVSVSAITGSSDIGSETGSSFLAAAPSGMTTTPVGRGGEGAGSTSAIKRERESAVLKLLPGTPVPGSFLIVDIDHMNSHSSDILFRYITARIDLT